MQLQWCSGPNSSECEGISLRNLDERSREEVRQYLQGDVGSRKHFLFRKRGGASREKDLEGYRRERCLVKPDPKDGRRGWGQGESEGIHSGQEKHHFLRPGGGRRMEERMEERMGPSLSCRE